MNKPDILCNEYIQTTAKLFRLGMEAQASESLVKFIDTFAQRLSELPPDLLPRIQPILNEIFSAQSRKDYLRVADLLEYEIAALLLVP